MELTKEKAIEILKKIQDPELMLDIYTLGLIYDLSINQEKIDIKMTFTSPMCPYGPQILSEVEHNFKNQGFITKIELTFSPPWEPTEEVKELLGLPL